MIKSKKRGENSPRAAKAKAFFAQWTPVVVWAVFIFVLSAYPTKQVSEVHLQDFIVKKTAHVIEYGIFAGLLYRAFKKNGVKKRNAGIYSIFAALIYGASDELHQSFTPGRDPKLRDVAFDTIGAVFAIYIIWNLLPKAPKRLKAWAKKLQIL